MVNSYYTDKVREELEERERRREFAQQASRERVKKMARAYDNMNHYYTSSEQQKLYEAAWKSLL